MPPRRQSCRQLFSDGLVPSPTSWYPARTNDRNPHRTVLITTAGRSRRLRSPDHGAQQIFHTVTDNSPGVPRNNRFTGSHPNLLPTIIIPQKLNNSICEFV